MTCRDIIRHLTFFRSESYATDLVFVIKHYFLNQRLCFSNIEAIRFKGFMFQMSLIHFEKNLKKKLLESLAKYFNPLSYHHADLWIFACTNIIIE